MSAALALIVIGGVFVTIVAVVFVLLPVIVAGWADDDMDTMDATELREGRHE